MCCMCNWIAWSFDFVQRVITFLLTCCLCVAICYGLALAIITGIAYGYNYSLAEWLTFTRSDVTVYMRRGQFFDRPNLRSYSRRSGDEEDAFSSNATTDYEDSKQALPDKVKPLSDTWMKTQDARKYAEKLIKYAPQKMNSFAVNRPTPTAQPPVNPGLYILTTLRSRLISIKPNPIDVETTLWQSGSSHIVMRNFEAIDDVTSHPIAEPEYPTDESQESDRIDVKAKKKSNSKLSHADAKEYAPRQIWPTTLRDRPSMLEYGSEEAEDDNIMYKPV